MVGMVGTGRLTLVRALGQQFGLSESVIRDVLKGKRPPGIPDSLVRHIQRAFSEAVEGKVEEAHTHRRRAPRFGVQHEALLNFYDARGKVICRGRGDVQDISVYGALIHNLKLRAGCIPAKFHRLTVQIEDLQIEARLKRFDTTMIGVEFAGVDWQFRQAIQSLLV